MIIYIVVNKINNKAYVGQTTRMLKDRWSEHCKPALRTRSYLSNAIQKHGKENFTIKEIYKANSQNELDTLEKMKICEANTLYPNGYNLTEGGSGGAKSSYTKEKIRKASLGKIISEETKQK